MAIILSRPGWKTRIWAPIVTLQACLWTGSDKNDLFGKISPPKILFEYLMRKSQ
jgi:hypothetical protein